MGLVRIADGERVHFRNPCDDGLTVCGKPARSGQPPDLFNPSQYKPYPVTDKPVDCPACATIWCAAKYEPWHAVEDQAMDRAMLAAVGVNPDAFADGVDQPTESEVQ